MQATCVFKAMQQLDSNPSQVRFKVYNLYSYEPRNPEGEVTEAIHFQKKNKSLTHHMHRMRQEKVKFWETILTRVFFKQKFNYIMYYLSY